MDFNKPEVLKTVGDLAENFERFKEEVLIYFVATETDKKTNKVQVARLKNLLGPEACRIYRTLAQQDENETIVSILNKLEEYFVPKKNETLAIFKFFSRTQLPHESFDQYYLELKNLISPCQFSGQENKILRSQIIIGIFSKSTKQRLLREDLSLDEVVNYCKSTEAAEQNLKQMNNGIVEVDYLNTCDSRIQRIENQSSNQRSHTMKSCYRCGLNHDGSQCPALNRLCLKCKKLNHFASVCRSQIDDTQTNDEEGKELNEVGVIPVHTIKSLSSKRSVPELFNSKVKTRAVPLRGPTFDKSQKIISKRLTFCHDYQNGYCWRYCCKYVHCTRAEENHFRQTGELNLEMSFKQSKHFMRPYLFNKSVFSSKYANNNPMQLSRYNEVEPYARRRRVMGEENAALKKRIEDL